MTKKEIRVAYCAAVLITAVTASMFFNVNDALGSPLEETTLKCSGKVVDSGGAPVNGAKVKLCVIEYKTGATLTFETRMLKEVTTGPDGEYSLEIKSTKGQADLDRMFIITVEKEGLAIGWADWYGKEDKKELEIKLAEPKELTGVVVNENNEPIEDAQVKIFMMTKGQENNPQMMVSLDRTDLLEAKTDSEGKFLFKNIPADANAEFIIKKAGRATICTYTFTGGMPGQYRPGQSDIKFIEPVESKIEGQVVEKSSGKGAGGINIILTKGEEMMPYFGVEPVVSKEDGTFILSGLPADTFNVTILQKAEEMSEWLSEPVVIETERGKTASGVKIEVSKGGAAEIVVTDTETKRPIEGATVSLYSTTGYRIPISGNTDKEGIARIKLAAGEYQISGAYKPGTIGGMSSGQGQKFTIEEGKTERLEIQLKGPRIITGVVKDKTGRPLAAVKLKLVPQGISEATSDSDGKYEIEWDPTRWGGERPAIYLIGRDEKNNLAGAIEIDEESKDVEIKLREGIVIAGRILDPDKKPIEGAKIQLYFKSGNYSSNLTTQNSDKEGKFEINAVPPDNSYYINSSAEGFGKNIINFDSGEAIGNRYDAGDITLDLANLSVSGIVVDTNDEPVEGVRLYVYGDNQPDRYDIKTDKDGKFTIDKVCAGRLNISANLDRPLGGYMYGSIQTEGGAEDVKIIVSERGSSERYVPRKPASLKGKALPELKDLGIEIPTADANDKMICLCFFDMQQRPSRHMVNELAKQAEALKDKGVIVAIVQTAKVEENTLKEWIEKYNISFPAGQISSDVEKTKFNWGVQSLPWLILTDKKHIIKAEGFALSELNDKIKEIGGQ